MPVKKIFKHSHLAAAIVLGLVAPGIAFAQASESPPPATAAKTLDAVTVTGSRIKRTEVETALPVTVIQREQFQAQGITSAEQLLQFLNVASNSADSLSANSGVAPPGTRGNNGVSGANLRGQGADATLVLLNGRRVAAHGLAGQVVDLNSIPFAAIERVEVLRDGASAVYGTDAIGGVINFITRNDYQGLTASTNLDITHDGGGSIYSANILGGIGDLDNDGWNIWGTVGWKKNEILTGRQRDFANSFQPERGLSPDSRGTPFATLFNVNDLTRRDPVTNVVTPLIGAPSLIGAGLRDPADNVLMAGINILDLPDGAGCENGGDMMGSYDERIWSSVSSRYACAWDYGRARTIQQPVETVQFLGRATFKISDNHQAYFEAMGSDVKSTRHFEAQQISSAAQPVGVASAFDLGTWYPLNDLTRDTYNMIYNDLASYFGTAGLNYGAPIAYRWRCEACGPRQIETTTKASRFLLGFEGVIGSWDYTAGLSRATSESQSVLGGGYYYTQQLKPILGSGLLNPFLLPGQQQSAAAMAALQAASAQGVELYTGKSTSTILDASFSGGLGFDLPGGEVQAAVGMDLRREEYEFSGRAEAAQGNAWIFGIPGDAQNYMPAVRRDVKAAFAEFYLPVVDSLELTLAARRDQYDGFGGTTNPKYSFKYQPVDWLAFRGAYSTGFKVPSFAQLYRGVTETPYQGNDLADPRSCPGGAYNPGVAGCDVRIQPDILSGGNRNLTPEESKQKSIGFVLAPTPNFNLSVDWWEIERLNTIRSGFNLSTMTANYDLYASNFIRDAGGNITEIDQRFINTGGTLTSGIELDANLNGELAGGAWNIHLNGSYLDNFQTKSFTESAYSNNLVGMYERYFNLPIKWKHTLGFAWSKGDWAHSLTQVYRGGYDDWKPPGIANGSYTPVNWSGKVDEYITYNYSLTWVGIDQFKVILGVRNLLNTDPPFTVRYLDDGDGAAWEARVADPRGRSYNLNFEFKFF